jgi:NitT/TauT family transport system substrate-binding protein
VGPCGLGLARAMLAAALPAVAGEKAPFRLNWCWRGIRAPFALAVPRGELKPAGVDIELLEGRGSAITARSVGAKADAFGFVDGFEDWERSSRC